MATIIQLKRSSTATAPATLKLGEAAYTYGTGTQANGGDRFYIGTGGVDSNGDALDVTVIGGEYFSTMLDHVHGTVTASSGVITDSNLAVDQWIIGNATGTGGTLKLNEGTSNGSNFIALKAPNSVTSTTTFTLPDGDGATGQFLKTDGSGNLDFATVDQVLTFEDDANVTEDYQTNETFTFTGGAGLTTALTANELTITAPDLTNANLSGSAGITNANLASPTTTLGSSTLTLGAATTDIAGITSIVIDDLTINGQDISTTASNKHITLTPHGTGTIQVPSGYEDRAGFSDVSLANKAYVDQVAQGLDTKPSCRLGTTANLAANYNNGTSGVGATLTATSNGALTLDGTTPSVNDRILVKDQTDASHNGIYKVTTVGDGSTAFVLTRATPEDQPAELTGGAFVFVEEGSANANNGYVFTHTGSPTFGTTDLDVAQFSGAGQITAGAGLTKTGNLMDANPDDSSIEVSSDQLRVKAAGITNAMLAGSIASDKLADGITLTDETSTAGLVRVGGTFEFLAGAGINTAISSGGAALTISGELASTSNIGVASFSSDNFTVASGDVTVTTIDGGTY